MELVQQSTTSFPLMFLMVDSTDHITGKTGLSPTVTLSKAGGSFAAPAGSVTEIGSGWYKVAGNATDLNTLGLLILHATATGADPADTTFSVVAFNPHDAVRLGLTGIPNATAGASGGLLISGSNSGTTTFGALTVTGAATFTGGIAGDITGNITGNLSGSVGSLTTNNDKTGYSLSVTPPTAATIATTIWTDLLASSDFSTASSVGKLLKDNIDTTISSRGTSTLTQTQVTGGAYSIQSASCVLGDARIANLDATVSSRASQTSVDTIDGIVDSILVDTAEIGAAGAGLTAIPWNVAWDAEVQSEVDDALVAQNLDRLVKIAVDTDFATTVHLNSVIGHLADNGTSATFDRTSDSLEALRDNTGTAGAGLTAADDAVIAAIGALSIPTAAANADAVWDEALSGHLTAGSTGEALSNAGAAGDPWGTALPGAYGVGTAGYIIGTNLDASVNSRATQSSVTLLAAEVGANGANLNAIPWNSAWDAEVQSEVDDALVAQNLDHLLKIAVDTDFPTTVHLNSVVGHLVDNGTSATFDRTTDSLEALRDNTGTAGAGLTAADDAVIAAIAALNNISTAQVNAEVDTALADVGLTTTITGRIDAAVSSRSTLTQTQVTGGAYTIQSSSCVLGDARIANLDATVSSRGTSTLTQTQVTGGAYSIQSASCVLGDARIANLDAAVSTRMATFTLPTNFSVLSISAATGLVDITQTAADKVWATATRVLTAGTNIALAKGVGVTGFNDIAATAIVSGGAITTSGGAVSTVNTTVNLTTNNDKTGYSLAVTPPTAATIATTIWTDLLASSDFSTASSIGKLLKDNIDATISSRASQTSVDTIDGIVDSILVDTAEIGAAGAGLTALAQASIWTSTVAGRIDVAISTRSTTADVADAVWDEVLSGHLTAGSTGAALNAAGSAGDPWNTALPGAYGVGSAGYIVGTNLNATVGSRATQTSVDTIDGIVDSILVDTAEIGVAGAGLTALASAANLAIVDGVVDSILVDTTEIGVAGAGLTALAQASIWTSTVAGRIDTTISSRGTSTLTQTQVTGGAYSVQSALCVLGDTRIANLDAAVSSRMATFTLPTNFSALSISATTGLVDITQTAADKVWATTTRTVTSGANIVLAKGVGVTGFNDLSAAQVNAEVDTALADYDAPTNAEMVAAFTQIKGATWETTDTLEAIRDRGDAAWVTATGFSTHTAADIWAVATRTLTSGANIVLAKGTGITGFNDIAATAIVSGGAITTSGGAVSNVTTTANLTTNNDKTGYSLTVTPPTAATIATTVWTDLLASSDFSTVASVGKLLKDNVDAAVSSRSTYAGGDTAGTTTLLTRLTATRAGYLDNLSAAAPTAAVVADAVWDELLSGHVISGSAGAGLSAASAAGDPWGTALPGAYAAGTAGYIVGTNLNATVASRSTYAGTDTSGTTTLLSLLTSTRAGYLDNLSGGAVALASVWTPTVAGRIDVAVSSRGTSTLTQTQVTGGAYSIQSSLCVLGDARIANLDATVSSRGTSTYAGGDTAGTTTLLTRLTSGRATNLDFLDASIASVAAAVAAIEVDDAAIAATVNSVLTSAHGVGPWTSENTGSGAVAVDHDYPTPDNLAIENSLTGARVARAAIYIYLLEDWQAGRKGTSFVRGETVTTTAGRWRQPIMLDPGEYLLVATLPGVISTITQSFEVT